MTTANIHLTIKGTLQIHHLQPGDTIIWLPGNACWRRTPGVTMMIATLEQHHPHEYLEALERHLEVEPA